MWRRCIEMQGNARLAVRFGEKIVTPMRRAYPREQGVESERELILEDARFDLREVVRWRC
jgi:hypothetical protein